MCTREVCSIPQGQDGTSQADALPYFSTFLRFAPFPSVWSGNKPVVQMLPLALLSSASQVVLAPWVVASLQEPFVCGWGHCCRHQGHGSITGAGGLWIRL